MSKPDAPQVIGIASGKGGVGKTTVSVNLAVALVQKGYRVMLLDADLGMANAQIALGVHAPLNISHVLSGEKRLDEVVVTTSQGVRLVPGSSGIRDMAALTSLQIAQIVRAFDELTEPLDFLLVDVAAGISPQVLDLMGACQRRLVVVCDQPSSIADAYGLIKVMTTEQQLEDIYLVPNMVSSVAHGLQLYRKMNDVCVRFLGQGIRFLHAIEADELVLQSQRKYQSVMEHAPGSSSARDFRQLVQAIEQSPAPDMHPSGLAFLARRQLTAHVDR